MHKVKSSSSNKNIWKDICLLLIGAIIGSSISFLGMYIYNRTNSENSDGQEDAVLETDTNTESNDNDTTQIDFELRSKIELHGDEITQAIANVDTVLDNIKEQNGFFEIATSESAYSTFVYNKTGECFTLPSDLSYRSVFLSDGTGYTLDNGGTEIYNDSSIDAITLYDLIMSIPTQNIDGATFYEMTDVDTYYDRSNVDEEETDVHEYAVELIGEEAVKASYRYNENNNDNVDELYNTLVDGMQLSDPDWEPHLIYTFYISNDKNITMYCFVVTNGQQYISYNQSGYISCNEWKLDAAWYDKSSEPTVEMMNKVTDDIKASLEQMAIDNNIELTFDNSVFNKQEEIIDGSEDRTDKNETSSNTEKDGTEEETENIGDKEEVE